MSWANYEHILPGFVTCEPCTLSNLKQMLDSFGDKYDETDILTLERAIEFIDSLNAVDGIEGDEQFAPVPFNPTPGTTCRICQKVAENKEVSA
jgi:hypothetical protein